MKLHTLFSVFLLILSSLLYSQTNSTRGNFDKTILKKSDDAYFPNIAKFSATMKLFENGKYDKYYELTVYIKGNQKYLAIFDNPPITRRRATLRVGDKILFYLGKINRTTEMSAKAAFSGSTLSEEDVLSAALGNYYDLEKVEKTKLNGQKVLKLFLKSRSKETSYYRIESYINAKTLLPIKREYFSFSNQKIKEMEFIEIKKKGNKTEYIHFIMYDSLRKGTYTDVIMQNFTIFHNLDNRMFTKRYMEIATQ